MGVRERKKRAKDQLRLTILAAAESLFISEGYANVSMRKIAERIEYSPTTIYLYFKDKSELVRTLIEENFAKLLSLLETAAGDDWSDPVACLRRTQRTFVEFGLGHPDHYRLLFISGLETDSSTADSADSRSIALLRKLSSACVERGFFRTSDPELATQTLWSSVHGLTSLLITHTSFPWIERETLIDFAINSTINGLLSEQK